MQAARILLGVASVDQFQRELPLPCVVGVLNLAEVAGPKFRADSAGVGVGLKLSVVPRIEGLGSELHAELLGYSEVLEQRKVEIITTRPGNCIEAQVSKATSCAVRG